MTPDELFDGIAADLAPRGVTTGILFGKRALKAHDKAFACLLGDNLAFKLGEGTPPTPKPSLCAGLNSSTHPSKTTPSRTGSLFLSATPNSGRTWPKPQ